MKSAMYPKENTQPLSFVYWEKGTSFTERNIYKSNSFQIQKLEEETVPSLSSPTEFTAEGAMPNQQKQLYPFIRPSVYLIESTANSVHWDRK